MGYAGAIVRGSAGNVTGKQEALRVAGVEVLESPIHVSQWAKKTTSNKCAADSPNVGRP